MRKELMQPSTKKTVVEGWCFFFSRNEFVEVCSTQTTFSVLFESLAKVQGALEKARDCRPLVQYVDGTHCLFLTLRPRPHTKKWHTAIFQLFQHATKKTSL